MKCFVCKAILTNINLPCPKCGYKFSADTNEYCPNNKFGKCELSGEMCTQGINYSLCPVKAKADSEFF